MNPFGPCRPPPRGSDRSIDPSWFCRSLTHAPAEGSCLVPSLDSRSAHVLEISTSGHPQRPPCVTSACRCSLVRASNRDERVPRRLWGRCVMCPGATGPESAEIARATPCLSPLRSRGNRRWTAVGPRFRRPESRHARGRSWTWPLGGAAAPGPRPLRQTVTASTVRLEVNDSSGLR